MSQASRTWSTDSADAVRKRVCKACDRCRLKKSKCDGSSPCLRCKADNAICVFGERKKSHDKVYPKGYVEMLEQQQAQLVAGLQEMYKRLSRGQEWSGPQLSEASGHPLTHDILAALNLLEPKGESGEMESFEEDCQKLQAKLLAEGAPYIPRRASFSSDSEHSQGGHQRTASMMLSLATDKTTRLREGIALTPSPSPLARSPAPQHQQQFAPVQTQSPLSTDPQFYRSLWSQNVGLDDEQAALMRGSHVMNLDDGLLPDQAFADSGSLWNDAETLDFDSYGLNSYMHPAFATGPGSLDPMDLDLSRHVRVAT